MLPAITASLSPPADPGEAQQDVQLWSVEEAAEAAEEHGSSQSHAGPAAGVLRPGETSPRQSKSIATGSFSWMRLNLSFVFFQKPVGSFFKNIFTMET